MGEPIRYAAGGITVPIGEPTQVEIPSQVYCGRLTCIVFDTDKTFMLPRALKGIKGLRRFYDKHPGAQVLVSGHCDWRATDEYNLTLSNDRAASIAAYLRDDVDVWLAWYHAPIFAKRWGSREDQHMLAHLPDGAAPFYSGPITGSPSADAVRRFQTWSNQQRGTSLVVDGIAGDKTRRELVAAYMAIDGTTLPAGTVLKTHGCGEFHPMSENPKAPPPRPCEDPLQRDRRVEVFFFEGAIDPPPPAVCVKPGCREYPTWLERSAETVDLCESAKEPVKIRLFDPYNKPLVQVACQLRVDGKPRFSGKSDASGYVSTDALELPTTCEVRWQRDGNAPDKDDDYLFTREVYVDIDEADEDKAVEQRLSNLGYRYGDTLRDNVKAFQRETGLEETGEVADVAGWLRTANDCYTPAPKEVPDEPFEVHLGSGD